MKITVTSKIKLGMFLIVCAFLFSFVYSSLTDSFLLDYYKMDTNSSNIMYDELNFNNGTFYKSVTNLTGIINNSINFSNSYSFISSKQQYNFSDGNFSLSLWVYLNKDLQLNEINTLISRYQSIYGVAYGWECSYYRNSTGQFIYLSIAEANNKNQQIVVKENLTLNEWNHLVFIGNVSDYMIYKEGTLKTKVQQIYRPTNKQAYNISVGAFYYQNVIYPRNLSGRLDEIGIWNRSLSEDEILELYNNGNGLTYPFNQEPPESQINCTAYSGSGDYSIDCSDNCHINNTLDLGGNSLILYGLGTIYADAEIQNANIQVKDGCKGVFKTLG